MVQRNRAYCGEGDVIECVIGEGECVAMAGEAELIAFLAGVPW